MGSKSASTRSRGHAGFEVRHSRTCATRHAPSCASRVDRDDPCDCGAATAKCNCDPTYQAHVWDAASGQRIRKTFPTLDAARGWRADAQVAVRKGTMPTQNRQTVRQAADGWLEAAKAGLVRTRSGQPYKPSALRSYESDLTLYLLPALGTIRLTDLRRRDVQALVDRLVAKGFSASKVRNAVMPLRAIIRRALENDEVIANATMHLRLPALAAGRERSASPSEAAELLDALAEDDRALWATAFYAGLRRGELRGLRWDDVDLARGVIHVRRGWDDVEGEIDPKSRKGTRTVPIAGVLRDYLDAHKARTRREGDALVFGSTGTQPFTPSNIRRRAATAWAAENIAREKKELDPLQPIGLHECRHTFVSIFHDAGLSLERIGDYVGHSSAYMTDRYRHLLDGHETQAAALLDAYLERADTAARVAQIG